jgi:hypothetical protein
MGKVSESIYSDEDVVIPMADVQHIEKKYHTCDLTNGTKKGDLLGAIVVTKHTRWDMEADCWANNIWLSAKQVSTFLRAWCEYRYELEKDTCDGTGHDGSGINLNPLASIQLYACGFGRCGLGRM